MSSKDEMAERAREFLLKALRREYGISVSQICAVLGFEMRMAVLGQIDRMRDEELVQTCMYNNRSIRYENVYTHVRLTESGEAARRELLGVMA